MDITLSQRRPPRHTGRTRQQVGARRFANTLTTILRTFDLFSISNVDSHMNILINGATLTIRRMLFSHQQSPSGAPIPVGRTLNLTTPMGTIMFTRAVESTSTRQRLRPTIRHRRRIR